VSVGGHDVNWRDEWASRQEMETWVGPDDESMRARSLADELTDGYARALTIEAECLATMRQISEAAYGGSASSPDVRDLATHLGALQAELKELRALLEERRRSVDPHGELY
jgi:hypothetical protein